MIDKKLLIIGAIVLLVIFMQGKKEAGGEERLWLTDSSTDIIYKLDPSDGSVIDSFPSPDGWPKGLTWDGTHLWNTDSSTDIIYKLDPSDGTVLSGFDSPGDYPHGLTWDGTYLWNVDYQANEIYKLDPSDGSVIDSFPSSSPDPRGLTWDGTYLWNVDYQANEIYKLDPSDGTVLLNFDSPVHSNGLTWDGTHLWAVSVDTDIIYKLDPSDGSVIDSFPSPSGFATGLAWTERCIPDNTCQSLGYECGSFTDSCADVKQCGSCGAGKICDGNLCVQKTCVQKGGNTCNAGETCSGDWIVARDTDKCCGGVCETPCTPDNTCQSLGYECGSFTDSCADVKQCGSCGARQTCDNHHCVEQETEYRKCHLENAGFCFNQKLSCEDIYFMDIVDGGVNKYDDYSQVDSRKYYKDNINNNCGDTYIEFNEDYSSITFTMRKENCIIYDPCFGTGGCSVATSDVFACNEWVTRYMGFKASKGGYLIDTSYTFDQFLSDANNWVDS